MKTSTALKLTKVKLWDGVEPQGGKSHFICWAAADAKVARKVKPIVMRLLRPHQTFGDWLRYEQIAMNPWEQPRKMQVTRHAWLDHLIAHYEAKGD